MAEEFIVKKLECNPRGHRTFWPRGLRCYGYDADDTKVNIGPYRRVGQPVEFYSVDLNLNTVATITSNEDLMLMIDLGEIRECNFEMFPGKRVHGILTC